MVMASGSGLDPHITLKNALYQLDRVAGAWAKKKASAGEKAAAAMKEKIKAEIAALLDAHASAPLVGLVGVKLINVLEINVAMAVALAGQ